MQIAICPFTSEQWNELSGEEKEAMDEVCGYLHGYTFVPSEFETFGDFNILRETEEGCVPNDEMGEDLMKAIHRKFACVYQSGINLAVNELKARGFKPTEHFDFFLLIDPDYEQSTHVVVLDMSKPRHYLHEWTNAWEFHYASLQDIATRVLAVRDYLVEQITTPNEIQVVLDGGLVQEVRNIPPGSEVVVIDYDVEGADESELEVSPIDNEICIITRYA